MPEDQGDSAVPQTTADKATAIRSMHLMAAGGLDEFQEVYTPDSHNREAKDEPPACRGHGPEALHATALWLREAFSALTWEVHDSVQEDDLVTVHATLSGRQTGTFVAYAPDASVAMAFPPRGRSFAVTQTHWFRMRDGKIAEHWANRDDRSMGDQLGWTPPTPVYLVTMLLARRRARRRATA